MNFSKTTEYALRIMSHMASDEKSLHSADEIFNKLNIPYRYLRKLLTLMSKTGLVKSVQGKNGGYRIGRSIHEISLLDIINVTGDNISMNKCFFGFNDCALVTHCTIHDKWVVHRKSIIQVLSTTFLSEFKNTGSPYPII